MRRNLVILTVLLLSLVLGLAACGGAEEPTPTPIPPTNTSVPATATPLPAPTAPLGDMQNGEVIFSQTCQACHGVGGIGVQGLGKDMTVSQFIAEKDDPALLEFLKKGRDPGDPLNTTGVLMPPKGGNPSLDDQKLLDVIAFVRTLQKK